MQRYQAGEFLWKITAFGLNLNYKTEEIKLQVLFTNFAYRF